MIGVFSLSYFSETSQNCYFNNQRQWNSFLKVFLKEVRLYFPTSNVASVLKRKWKMDCPGKTEEMPYIWEPVSIIWPSFEVWWFQELPSVLSHMPWLANGIFKCQYVWRNVLVNLRTFSILFHMSLDRKFYFGYLT